MNNKCKKKIIFVIIVMFLLGTSNANCGKKVVISKTASVQSQLKEVGVTYVIKYNFDLKGTEVSLPRGSKLDFQGGKFLNGTLKGDCTVVSAGNVRIFENVTISGSWSNKKVYSEWLDFVEGRKIDNAVNYRNLMLLCKGNKYTHLYTQQGVFYCSVKKEASNINVPSNLYWHNSSTICQLPTTENKYGFVLIQQEDNITIDGGIFIGDVSSHRGKEGEWGHGIKISGGRNIVLKNLTVRYFWGDGIDLIDDMDERRKPTINCENIVIKSVICDGNRRQGLSIESGINISVLDSEFINTGKHGKTPPGAGIDIEPWNDENDKIQNIKIKNCKMKDNWGYDLQLYANFKKIRPMDLNNKIKVNNCEIGTSYVYKTRGVSVRHCKLTHQLKEKDSYNIIIYK